MRMIVLGRMLKGKALLTLFTQPLGVLRPIAIALGGPLLKYIFTTSTKEARKMDQNQGIGRLHVVELGFNTTRMLFTFGNLGAIAIDALADLSDGSKLALSVAVVILNISCVLSFDAELKIYAALSKDAGDENSAYTKNSRETPWGVFRVFCLVICIAAAVTQWMAING